MTIIGLPENSTPPDFTFDTFKLYIPKMANYCDDPNRKAMYEEFVENAKGQLNYGFWGSQWKYAMSLAVAHWICITDPHYAQSVGEDSTTGGVMTNRSVGGISYSYDISKTIADNPAYLWWNRTGYGATLVALSLTTGYVGMLIGT